MLGQTTYLGGTDPIRRSQAKTSSDFAHLAKPKPICDDAGAAGSSAPALSKIEATAEKDAGVTPAPGELALKSEMLDGVPMLKVSRAPASHAAPAPAQPAQPERPRNLATSAADPGPAVDFVVAPEPEHEQQLEPGPEQEPEQEIVEEATENLEATNEPAPQRDGTEVDANEVADDPFVHAMGLDGKDVPPGPEEKMSGWESEQKPATA